MFRVGQKVVCIKVGDWTNRDVEHRPTYGEVYTIRAIGPAWPIFGGGIGVLLEEIRNPPDNAYRLGEASFKATRFRPVVERKTDISIFTAMLNPAKKRRRADRPVTVS